MYTLRTRFAKEIVCEFLPPYRPTKKQRVIIFADGMPGVPSKKSLLEFFSKKGFWVFHPRYRGTWESNGKLFAKSPHQDLLDIIDQLPKGFKNLWNNETIKLVPQQIILLGSSFGGPAALIAGIDSRISKVIAIAPVIDWTKPGRAEPIKFLAKFTEQAFGNGYKIAKNGWSKISSGKFYNPINHLSSMNGKKILLIHAKDDSVCKYSETKKFATRTDSKLISLPRGDHLGLSILLKPRFYKLVTKFINSK